MRLIFIISFLLFSFIGFSQYSRDGKGIKYIQLEGCKIDATGQPCDSCFVMTWGVNGKLNKCLHISQLRDIITGGNGSIDSVYLVNNVDGSYTLINENDTQYDFGYEFLESGDTLFLVDLAGNKVNYVILKPFQTLSWDPVTGDLGISYGNTVNLDGRYLQSEIDGDPSNELQFIDTFLLSGDTLKISIDRDSLPPSQVLLTGLGDGNGIYSGSGQIPANTYAYKHPINRFGIGYFQNGTTNPSGLTDNGIFWNGSSGVGIYAGDSLNDVSNHYEFRPSGFDLSHSKNFYHTGIKSYYDSLMIYSYDGGLTGSRTIYRIDSLTEISQNKRVNTDKYFLKINGSHGNNGDVLTSDGYEATWQAGGGGGFTLDSVLLKLSGNVMTSKVNTTSDTSLVIGSHSIVLSGSVLTSQVNGVSDTADISSLLTTGTTNVITQNGNQLTSVVNGVSDTTLTVRSVSNTSSVNNLSTTVNGVTGSNVNIINSNTIGYSGSILTSTINGVTDTALITTGGLISDVDLDLSGNIMTSDVDGVNDTSLVVGNVTTYLSGTILTTSVNGVSDTAQLSSLVSAATTNTLNGAGNIATSTVNGVADTMLIINQLSLINPANTITVNVNGETSSASAITSYSNGGTDNTSTISINGVGSASTTIIRSNELLLGNDSLKTRINGIVSNAVPLDSILLNGGTNSIGLSGNTITSTVNTISDTCLAIGNNTLSYDQGTSIMTSSINGVSDTAYMGNFNVIQYVDSIKTKIDANSGLFSTGWSLYQDSQAPTYIAWDSLGYMNYKSGNVATYSGLPLGVLPYSTTGMNGAKFQINDSTTNNVNWLHVNNKRTGNLIADHTISTTHWIDTITQSYRVLAGGALSSLQRGLVMDTMGMVGIGVQTPSYELDVTGSTRLNGHLYDINNSSGTNGDVLTRTTSGIDWIAPAGVGANIISPAQITSDQDNWNPTGFADATVVRVSGDNGIRAITSMSAQSDGEEKKIINVGSYPIYFPSEHPDGTAANRISYREDMILMPYNSITFYYDGTTSRWIPLNYQEETETDHIESYDIEPGSVTTGEIPIHGLLTTGTYTATVASATLPMFSTSATTGASSTAAAGIILTKTSGSSYGACTYISYSHISISSSLLIPTLSDGTDSFDVSLACSPSGGTAFENNSFGIVYSHGMYGGNWTGYTRDGSTTNKVDLGVAVAANTVYYLRCEIDKSRTEVRYYINGVYKGRSAANIPAASAVRANVFIDKGVGTTSRGINIFNLRAKMVLP